MIYSLKGKVTYKEDRAFVLEVSGIGYLVYSHNNLISDIKEGEEKTILVTHIVREDSEELYGFSNRNEKRFFDMLINISGIGPKTAIGVINSAPLQTLITAIKAGESGHLLKVGGIGRKIAEKIILELREKVESAGFENMEEDKNNDIDVIEALKSLGYNSEESRQALRKIDYKLIGTENRIKAVLKILNK